MATQFAGPNFLWLARRVLYLWLAAAACTAGLWAQTEESTRLPLSVTEAARQARERQQRSTKHPRVITNEDLERLNRKEPPLRIVGPRPRPKPQFPASPSIFTRPRLVYAALQGESAPGCPEANQLRAQIAAAEQDLEGLRTVNDAATPVISGRDLDLGYFQSGNTGLHVGTPPRSDAQPQSATRVAQREAQDRLDALRRQLEGACVAEDLAEIRRRLLEAKDELDLSQRQFQLDVEQYYRQSTVPSTSGLNPSLRLEQERIGQLQGEVEQLNAQLAAAAAQPALQP